MGATERLSLIMKVQAVAFAVYGLTLFLIPDFTLDTIFGWENPDLFWARAIGVPFLGITLLEWHISSGLETRSDLVYPFVLIPGLFVAGFLWSEFADELAGADGHEFFFWFSFGVALFFFLLVAWAWTTAARERVS